MNEPKQTRLFDELPLPSDLIVQPAIPGSSKHLDPEQRRFNKLANEVQALREELATWQSRYERLRQQLVQDFIPLENRLKQARIDLVKGLDRVLSAPKGQLNLSRKRREGLEACLLWLVMPLMEEVDDPVLVAIHDRYSPFTSEESAELDRAIVEGMFGPDALEGFAGGDLDDMLEHAQTRQAERQAKRQAKAAERKTSQAVKLAQAQEEAQHAVREVYRKLASQLHPDRETDETQRRQKTDLMQRVNAAYEKGDLLTLLTLQLECEQLDADRLAELPIERIKRYNHALREQIRALEEEKTVLMHGIADLLELPPYLLAHASEQVLMENLDGKLEMLQASIAQLEGWTLGLADPARRHDVIAELLEEMRQAEDELGLADLETILMAEIEPAPKAKPNRRKKKARRR
jgi:hypothetical protein